MSHAPECSGRVYSCTFCDSGLMTIGESHDHAERFHPESIIVKSAERPEGETALDRAYRLGRGIGGLDAAGVKRLVEMSRENANREEIQS